MNKKIYIIPGWQETTRRKCYRELAKIAESKKYEVVFKNVDWTKNFSEQIFDVEKNSVIFGFSLGAVLAFLVAQKYDCKKLILASATPHYSFSDKKIKKALVDLIGKKIVDDVIKNLKTKTKAEKVVTIYGDKEGERADILVKNTDHEITENYLKVLNKIL